MPAPRRCLSPAWRALRGCGSAKAERAVGDIAHEDAASGWWSFFFRSTDRVAADELFVYTVLFVLFAGKRC